MSLGCPNCSGTVSGKMVVPEDAPEGTAPEELFYDRQSYRCDRCGLAWRVSADEFADIREQECPCCGVEEGEECADLCPIRIRDELNDALNGVLKAYLYEAAQGDGVDELFVPQVEKAKAVLAKVRK